MNQYWMVVLIVLIVMTASVLRARFGYHRRRRGGVSEVPAEEHAETLRLREEVKALKDRIHVLERITVEKENTLSRQIEELRDR
jgi:hypothetical protein